MSSLWTPGGEHRVPPPGESGSGSGTPAAPAVEPEPAGEQDGPSEEELARIAQQIAAAPVEDVIANHCYGLFELAAIHLAQQPPQLEKARLAIDALAALVDGLEARLGAHRQALADGLMQLRLAFASIANAAPASDGHAGKGDTGTSGPTPE